MMPTIFILFVIIVFAILAWRDLKLAIFVLLAALPSYLIRFAVGPIPTTLLEILLLILFIVALVRKDSRAHLIGVVAEKSRLRLIVLAMLLASAIAVLVSPDLTSALGVWKAYYLEPALFYFVLRSTVKSKQDVEYALMALGIGALLVSLIAVFQWITGVGIPIPWDVERRATSVYEYPNAVGLFVGPIMTIATVLLFQKTYRGFWLAVVGLGALAIIAAKTEAALIAIPASLFLVSLVVPAARRVTLPIGAIFVLIVVALPVTREKVLLQDYSGTVRRSQWTEAVAFLKDHPLEGAGLEGYPIAIAPYHTAPGVEVYQYPHNILLNIWVELGVLGLIVFGMIVYENTRRFYRTVLTEKPAERGHRHLVAIAIFAAFVEIVIHGLVDVPYFKNDLAVMEWSLFALFAIVTIDAKRRE